MAELSDYAAPFLHGLQTGAQIGHTIAQNQIERERQRRLVEQVQFANGIRQREQAIADAEAARKAAEYQGLVDLSNLAQNTPVPGGGDFQSMTPQEQGAALANRREMLQQHLPPSFIPRSLESDQSDYEKGQRLSQIEAARKDLVDLKDKAQEAVALMNNTAKWDRMIGAYGQRREMQGIGNVARSERATQAQQAKMDQINTIQSSIDARQEAKRNAKADEFPAGTPPDIYDQLLTAKDAGAKGAAVTNGRVIAGEPAGRFNIFSRTQPIDAIITATAVQVPPAVKRKIDEAHKNAGAEATSAAIAVPTAVAVDPLEGKVAVNPKTGEKLIRKDGKWQPLKQ